MSRKSRKQPEYWMRRAEQARAEAKSTPDTRTRSVLVGFATAYESLAKHASIRLDLLPEAIFVENCAANPGLLKGRV